MLSIAESHKKMEYLMVGVRQALIRMVLVYCSNSKQVANNCGGAEVRDTSDEKSSSAYIPVGLLLLYSDHLLLTRQF